MSQLIFRCPYTNQPIPSGIELMVETIGIVADYPISVHCPHCNCRHHGTIADGCLTDGGMKDECAPPIAPLEP